MKVQATGLRLPACSTIKFAKVWSSSTYMIVHASNLQINVGVHNKNVAQCAPS